MKTKVQVLDYIDSNFRKKTLWFLKLIISVTIFGYLIIKVKNHTQLSDFSMSFRTFNEQKIILILIAVLLSIPNWVLESVKWKLLLAKFEQITLKNSIRAVLGGLSIALLTPNRIGEIPGRAAFISKKNRKKSMLASSIGSACQSSITAILGLTSYIYLNHLYQFNILPFKKSGQVYFTFSLFVLLSILTYIIIRRVDKTKEFSNRIFTFFKRYSLKEIFFIEGLSILRYFIFISQFYLFLLVYDINISILIGFTTIALTYLIMFITPFLSLTEISVRGSASILCIGYFSDNIAGILLAGFSLWLINIIIPSIIGSIIIFFKKNQPSVITQQLP